jgi:hypothetical protein
MMLGARAERREPRPFIFWAGFAWCVHVLWFGTVIGESQAGMYNAGVDKSFRMGMMWFIFSEVMFFAAFFGADYPQLSVPWLGGAGRFLTNQFLWPASRRAGRAPAPRRAAAEISRVRCRRSTRDPATLRDHRRAPCTKAGNLASSSLPRSRSSGLRSSACRPWSTTTPTRAELEARHGVMA